MTQEEYLKKFNPDDAVGWDAMDALFETVYPKQEPVHYPMGSPVDPLNGVSIYHSEHQTPHFHYVSYGMSELFYDEEAAGKPFSKWGFEFTFRIKQDPTQTEPPTWPISLINGLATYVYKSQRWFEEYHVIPVQAFGIHSPQLHAVAFIKDPEFGLLETPHGQVVFLQMVALSESEFQTFSDAPTTEDVEALLSTLQTTNPLLLCDALSIPNT